MQYKEWSADFETGIGSIDQDHKTLFNSIRQLGQHISEDRGLGRVTATINSLILYVDEHFEREERFMIRAGYPDFEKHKEEHDNFRDTIYSLKNFHEHSLEHIDAQKVVTFLEDWLHNHILKVDMEYAPYLTGEKPGNPEIMKIIQDNKLLQTTQVRCPANKEEQVKHFINLISHPSEEGLLVEAAVEKITQTQTERRENKAKALFGK